MNVLFSDDVPRQGWSDAHSYSTKFGPKGSLLLSIPRNWTPPFALISAGGSRDEMMAFLPRIMRLSDGLIIVRSSVLGESIWDRGTYESVTLDAMHEGFARRFVDAVDKVVASAADKPAALVVQRFVTPDAQGEFGNLLRISKTRDHWELSTATGGATSKTRLNAQRDEAADPDVPLRNRPARERLFGSVAAWLNNDLLRGRPNRLNCEWVIDSNNLYIVQLDEEDEDHVGVNPFQLRVSPSRRPVAAKGAFLTYAEGAALHEWDKLKVLDELWEPEATHKPTLFFVPLSDLDGDDVERRLTADFRNLVAAGNIVVRTTVRAGKEKPLNLPRTEGLDPEKAAAWCLEQRRKYLEQDVPIADLALVTHHFVPARASAWARAEPGNPNVDIHGLWGLPDALQYCPYDIWEVHVPTDFATEYPEYKSNMLVARDNGEWEYVRIKNEIARHLSVNQRDALEIAKRTLAIANRLNKPCHVMWFVGCIDEGGKQFNIPWYWTEAHETEQNLDRTSYRIVSVSDPESLQAFKGLEGSRVKQAVQLQPTHDYVRDMKFIGDVGAAAKAARVPVILQGSTLAHAYYQLRREGCTVVTTGEKEHSRIRRNATLGKLVRDKIPERIATRHESETTLRLSGNVVKGFLFAKLFEEAMEVRYAEAGDDKANELADLYEVFRALAHAENISLKEISIRASEKRKKAGGFGGGIVLLQTGIRGRSPSHAGAARKVSNAEGYQVLAHRISENVYEIPFSFFGFMESGITRSLALDGMEARLDVVLKTDRIVISVVKNAEQLELPLDLTVGPTDDES